MKPTGQDAPTRYRAPREDATHALTLSEELYEASILNPLQSSQPDAADSSGTEGPKTPLHYSEASPTMPPFDLAQLGILPKMSPVTEQENDLLNMVPGSPVRRVPGLNQSRNRSERSLYSRSPMSIGSPAGASSLIHALQVRTCLATPAIFSSRRESPAPDVDEEMDAAPADIEDDSDED